ncbi:putative aminohydrolase SsnA [bacterium]|nr:putative aminohydrolase SsnA [candidate division CSSED10-310 bacterium]
MIIANGRIVTLNQTNSIIENGAVRIDGDRISDVDSSDLIRTRYPEDPVIDAENMLIMPGNICGHTHFYGAFARGLGIPGSPPAHFVEILQKLWWNLDIALTPEAVKYSAMVCLIDAIRHGTTTLFDHHASPSCIDGSLDIIEKAVRECGLRACLCYEVTDRNGIDEADAGIRENIRFMRKCRTNPDPVIAATFGMHASLTLSDDTLERCLAELEPLNSGIHIHAAEGIADQLDCLKKHGVRVINRLMNHRLLGNKSILAHCVHVNDEEMNILSSTGTRVTHQPRSNMNNAVGTAPVDRMLEKGIAVSMGNDGFGNSMWEEWKTAYLVHKLVRQDPRVVQGFDILKLGVSNNAALAAEFWPEIVIGTIEPGAAADLVLVDYKSFTPLHSGNLPWHILFGFENDMIHSTMAQGKWLMKNRILTSLDEERILNEAFRAASVVWKRFNEMGENS